MVINYPHRVFLPTDLCYRRENSGMTKGQRNQRINSQKTTSEIMVFPSISVFCICFLRDFRSLQVKPAFPPSALMCLFHPGHAFLNARPNTNSLSCHLKSSHSTTQVYLHPENQALHDFSVAGCIIPLSSVTENLHLFLPASPPSEDRNTFAA